MSTQANGPWTVVLAVVIALSFVGFFIGVEQEGRDGSALVFGLPTGTDAAAPPARSYSEQRRTPRGKGSGFDAELAAMRAEGPRWTDPVDAWGDPTAARVDRAENRAYDGAPPTIPHPIRQDSAPECLTCHGEGLRLREATASPMPHRELPSCTQCHVVRQSPVPGGDGRDFTVATDFEGLRREARATRASALAPPVVPHSTTMRERCLSCHGPYGRDALKTPHAERAACEQCHAPSAEMDLRPTRGAGER